MNCGLVLVIEFTLRGLMPILLMLAVAVSLSAKQNISEIDQWGADVDLQSRRDYSSEKCQDCVSRDETGR